MNFVAHLKLAASFDRKFDDVSVMLPVSGSPKGQCRDIDDTLSVLNMHQRAEKPCHTASEAICKRSRELLHFMHTRLVCLFLSYCDNDHMFAANQLNDLTPSC
jgi:hypothetical protein